MKFRNKKTGEVFPTITEAWTAFMCPGPCGDCNLQRGSTCEKEWIEAHPHEAARLMGYEVVEDEPEKTCDSCGYYKGNKVCGFKDFEIQITPEQGCAVWKPKEEANMDKPLKDWTLGEVEAHCQQKARCKDCDMLRKNGYECRFSGGPYLWDLSDKPRFTEQEVEDAKAIKRVFGRNGTVDRDSATFSLAESNLKFNGVDINHDLFPSIYIGQSYTLDEIIGGGHV